MELTLSRAKFLYYFNAGAFTKRQCVEKALKEVKQEDLRDTLLIYDITLNDYIEYLVERI